METLVNQFKSFLLELPSSRQGGKKGLSKVSVKNYLSDIRRFLDWLSQYQPQISSAVPQRLSSDHFQAYLDFLTHQDLPHSTISRHFSSLRRFATFIEIVYHQPPLIIPTITSPDSTPKPEPTSIQTSSPNLLSSFSQYLKDQQKSASTVRNYLSDIRHFLAWVDQHPDLKTLPSAQQLDSSLESDVVDQYSHYLELTNTPSSTSSRRLSSLNIFTQFATNQGLVTPKLKPETNSPRLKPIPALSWLKPKTTSRQGFNLNLPSFIQKPITRLTSSPAYRSYHQLPFTPYLHLALLVLFTSAFALFGFRQIIIQSERIAAYPSTPNRPTRQLSFQGRLTDSSGTPIVTPINATFKLWDQETGGTEGTCSGGAGEDCLYSTTTCSVDPDQDGIFNVLLGDGACGSEIPADVFTENTAVWLEVEVATETLTPRQPIATVAYALNSETVSGIPVSASGSATVNTLFFMNSSGEIVLGEQNPSIVADSGNFTLQGEALTLSTAPFSEGDITIAPDGIGQVNFIGGTTTDDFIRVVNANLTTGSLISGYVGNDNNTGELLRLSSGSSETDRFVVTTGGQTTIDALAGGKSAFIVNQLNSGPIFTASASGTPKFTINNSGTITLANNTIITDDTNYTRFSRGIAVGSNETYYFNSSGNINANNLTLSGTTTLNGLTYTWPSTQSSNYVLTTNGSGTLTWSDPTALAASTIYWNQANGSVYPKNATVDLLVGGNSTASAIFSVNSSLGSLTLKDSSLNTLFSVSPSGLVSNVPSSFTSSGNVSFAYDLLLTNQTASSITSNAPLTIEAGESFESNHLTLKTYNQGNILLDSVLTQLSGGLSVSSYATISSSLALGTSSAPAGAGHLSMSGNLSADGNLTVGGTTTFGSQTYTWPGSQTNNYVLSTNGSGTLSWVDPASAVASTIYWTQTAGALHPKNATVDLLVGGSASASAIFRVDATTGNLVSLSGAKWMPRSDSTSALNIANAAGTSFVTFDTTNQRVGIGTTSPDQMLHIYSTSSAPKINLQGQINSDTNTPSLLLTEDDGSDSGFFLRYFGNSNRFGIGRNGTTSEWLSILRDSGRVGIGTTSPQAILDINGGSPTELRLSTTSDNYYFRMVQKWSASDTLSFIATKSPNGTESDFLEWNYASGELSLQPYGGNVGIGTTAPSQKLDIAGALRLGSAGGVYDVLNTTGTGAGNNASGDLYWGNDPLLTSANIGSFGVSSVTNSDGTLNISPTTGDVVASLNLANANTWTAAQDIQLDSSTAFAVRNSGGTGLLAMNTNTGLLSLQGLQSTATLGSELVTNGSFDTDLTGWTYGGGSDWTWDASGKALHATGNTTALTQDITTSSGTTYQVTVTTSRTAGYVNLTFGDTEGSYSLYTSTYTYTFKANGTSETLTFTPSSDFDGTVDSISVKAITATSSPVLAVNNSDGSVGLELRSGGAGLNNSFLGYQAGRNNTTGNYNSFLGYQAGLSNTTGNYNSFLGTYAGYSNTTGYYNSFLGYRAGYINTTGNYNSFLGTYAGRNNTTGYWNSFLGYAAGYSNTTGDQNSFLGYQAGFSNTTGHRNSFLGYRAGYSNTTGYYNSFLGTQAGYDVTEGFSNTLLGYNTGRGITTGDKNTIVGANVTGLAADLSNNIILADGDGNQRIRVDSSGNVGIGTTAPDYKLDVTGDINFTGALRAGGLAGTTGQVLVSQGTSNPVWSDISGAIGGDAWLQGGNSFSATGILGTNDNYDLQFETNNTTRMTIDTSGNVGIGTTNPLFGKLEIYGNGSDTRLSVHEDAGTNIAGLSLRSGTRDWYIDSQEGVDFRIYRDTESPYLTIKETGNVGIGTTAPVSKLHVSSGDISIEDGQQLRFTGQNYTWNMGRNIVADTGGSLTDNTLQIVVYDHIQQGLQVLNSSDDVLMEVRGSDGQVVFNGGGNVGIGNTAPTSLLSVGSSSQFQVDSSGRMVRIDGVAHTIDDVSGNLTLTSNSSTISLNDDVTFAGTTTLNGLTYTWPSTQSTNYVLSTNGSGTLSWVDPVGAAATVIYWNQANGSLFPKNESVDLLVGGSATASAKFAFINVNSGTPTASISGTTANVATYLTGEGNLATTNMAPLTLGGASTGSISLANNTAITGNLTASGNTDVEGTLTSGTGNAFQVDATGNLSSTGTTGITLSGAGADLTFSGTGDHDITASAGTLRLGAATLTGSITGNSQSITGLSQLTVDNLRLDGNTIDTTTGNLTLDSAAGQVDVNDNLNITGSLTVGTTTTLNNITYTWPSSQSTNYVLSTNGSGTLSWVDPAGAASGAIYWAQSGGALYPKNATVDLLVGSSASASAIFRVDTSTGNLISVAGSNWMPRSNSTSALNIANAAGSPFVTFDTTNQRVGIGITAPRTKLHIADTAVGGNIDGLKISNLDTTANSSARIVFGISTASEIYSAGISAIRTNSPAAHATDLTFSTCAGSCTTEGNMAERLRLTSIGNLGLGLTSPTSKLHVYGDYAGNASAIIDSRNSSDILTASASGTPRLTILNNGNLQFHQASDITTTTGALTLAPDSASNIQFYSSSNTLSSTGNLTLAGNINLTSGDLQTGGTSRITNAGNLTNIGTTQFNGLTYTWPASHNSSGYILSNNGSGTLTWIDPATAAAGSIYWLQSDGAVYPKNATVDLLVGGNSTASAIFAIDSTVGGLTLKDSSLNTLFSVSPSGLVSNVPSSFTSSGNVSFAYDLLLTNQTASSIKSNAPLTIEAGESFESNDLTLKTYNQGSVVIDSILAELAGGLSVTDYATISSSLALGNTNAAAGPGHLNMTGNLTMDGNLNLTSGALQTNSTTRITNTGNLTNIGTTQFNGLTYTWPATHETSGYVLSNNGSGTLTWVDANSAASGSIYWTQTGAAVHPKNSTVDLLVGGSATSSAKFAVLNINSGTPTASISGTTANVATYLTGQGNLATTNMAPLTIGGSTTGSLTLDENTTITGNLALSGNEADLTFSGTGNHDITASAGTLRFGTATLTGAITGNSQNITGLNNLTGVTSTFSTSITTPLLTNAGNFTLSATGANNILFSTNGTERWRVTSTGILQSSGAQTIQTSNADLTLATGGGDGDIVLIPNGTGNVGINNASPAYKLDVTGDINFTGALRANGTAGTTGQVLVSQGTSNPVWSDISGAIGGDAWLQGGNSFGVTGVLGTNDNYNLQFETNNTTRMTLDTSGNIGINTTSPTARLDVAGTASLSGTLAFRGTTDPKIDILNGENLGIRTSSGGDTGLSERITVLSNGNIGIGDTTPASLLTIGNGDLFQINSSGRIVRIEGVAHTIDDVSGNLTLTSNSSTISLNDNVTFAGTTTLNGLTYTWPGSQTPNYVLSTDGSGTLTWVAADAAAAGSIYWTLTDEQLHPKNASWHDLMIGGTSTASAKFFAQANTGDGYFSGELGLGTTTPTAKLDIQATPSVYTSEVGNIRISNASDTTEKLYLGFDNNLGTYGSGYVQSSKTGTTWLPTLINPNGGYVGINNTSPSRALHVEDDSGIYVGDGTKNIQIFTSGTDNDISSSHTLHLNYSNNQAVSVGQGGTSNLYVSGSVGIGNTSPISLFSVGSSSQFQVNSSGNIVNLGGAAHSISNVSGNLTINSAGTLVLADTNIQLSGGSTTFDVYNNAADTTLTINNSSATYRSHLSLEGQLKLGTYTATPSGIAAGAVYYDTTLDRPYYFNGLGNWVPFSAGEGGDGSKWTITDGSLHPNNSTLDLTIGGSATSSAAFAFTGISSSTRTATISGNLALSVPTGSAPATSLNILNGGSFNLQTSVGGNSGLTSRLFISNDGKVGIGTTSPQSELHIPNGTIRTDGFVSESDWGSFGFNMYWDNAQSQWEYASNGYASLIQQDGTNGGLYIATATSGTAGNLASWSKALTIDVDGNVGIGTDTPQAKLDIAGASSTITNTSGDITINSASGKISFAGDSLNNFLHATASGQIRPGSYGSDPYPIGDGAIIYRSDLGQLNYYNGTSWQAIGSGSGSSYWSEFDGLIFPTAYSVYDLAVGGDTTDSAKFFVDHSTGDIKIADTTGTDFHTIANDGNNLKITGSPNGSKLILQPDLQINGGDILGSAGATRISLIDSLSLTSISGFLAVDRAATISAGLASDLTLHLKGAASQTANYMAITSNGGSTGNIFAVDSSGNVGIGTTSPSTKLAVDGGSHDAINALTTNGNDTYTIYARNINGNNGSWAVRASGTGNANGIYGASTTGWAGYFSGDAYISGNVGIGTTSPNSKLHLVHNNTTSATTLRGIHTLSSNSYTGTIDQMFGLDIKTANAGSGTVGELAGLHVMPENWSNSTTYNMYGIWTELENMNSTAVINGYELFLNGHEGNFTNLYGVYQSSAASNNYFAGNVGIGTTTPDAKLSLGSGLGKKLAIWEEAGTGAFQGFGVQQDQMEWIMGPNNGGTIAFGWGNTGSLNQVMTIKGTGRVGIGTTNPSQKLEVAGYVKSTRLMVDAGSSANAYLLLDKAGARRWHLYNDYSNDYFSIADSDWTHGVYLAQNSNSWGALSDARLKSEVTELESVTDRISKLSVISYKFRNNTNREIGIIAQEILPYFPEVVTYNGEHYGIMYDRIGVIALGGIKEQQVQLDDIELRLDTITGNLETINSDSITTNTATITQATVDTLEAQTVNTQSLNADSLTTSTSQTISANITGTLSAVSANINQTLTATNANITNTLTAASANISGTLTAQQINVGNLNIGGETLENYIRNLIAQIQTTQSITPATDEFSAISLSTQDLTVTDEAGNTVAQIDNQGNANLDGTVTSRRQVADEMDALYLTAQDLQADSATISELEAQSARIAALEAQEARFTQIMSETATISGTLAVGVMNQADAGTCNAAAEGRIFYDKGVRLYKACTYNSDNSSYAWRPLGGLSDQHRRNISTDSVVNNQVVRKGWTYAQGTGAVTVIASASYGITYDDVPIVLAVRAGTKTAAPAPTSLSQCTSSTYYIEKGQQMRNISTTGFQIESGSSSGTYPTSVYVCFTWIAIGTYSSGYGADLAEYYLTHDASLDAAEIVAIDPDNDIAVTKADPTTNPAVIGIVSTQAGAILGNKDGTTPGVDTSITGQEVENGSKTVPVALAGRVPVKVSLENGPIYRGDPLTLSPTLPGTAVKATTPGPIIGRALENFTGTATIVDSLDPDQVNNEQQLEQEAFNDLNQGIGKIMVFIQNSYYSPVMTASSATSSATIAFDHQGNLINPDDNLTAQAQAATQTDPSFFDRFISLIVKNLTALNITSRSITTQELVSPLVEADQVTTNTLTTNLIKPQSDSDLILSLNNQSATTPAQFLITDSQDNTVTSIDSSGNATFSGELVANSAKFDSLEVNSLKASQIEGLTDTLSQIKSASEAARLFLDRLTAKHSLQDESLNTTAQQLISTSSSQLLSSLENNFSIDSEGTHLALTGLSSDYAYFSDYLAVEGTLMTNDLYVENNLITSSISSPLDAEDQTLYLQPTGTGAINLLAGLLILDESGTVSLNGNLIVTGTLESGSATISGTLDLRATNLDNSGEATHSGFGRLLSIYNEQGEQVASVNASGSAEFNDLTTRQIIIAASQDSTPSANQASTSSNTTIGTATIPAGELTTYIENNNISDTTLIYLTPISDTKNQVLYVKNKYSCPVDAPLSCQPFFTVAINQPTTQDIQFNYWLIQTQ